MLPVLIASVGPCFALSFAEASGRSAVPRSMAAVPNPHMRCEVPTVISPGAVGIELRPERFSGRVIISDGRFRAI